MTDKTVLDAIENSLFDIYETVEGFSIAEHDPNYTHFLFPSIDFWEFNRNRVKNSAAGKEDEIIKQIMNKYHEKNLKSIAFVKGPLSSPPGLDEALKNNNFSYQEKGLGMVRSTEKPIEGDDCEFEIREVDVDYLGTKEFAEMFEKSYGMPEGSGGMFQPIVKSMQKTTNVHTYVAFDGDKPIAAGVLTDIPESPAALFGGASTLEEYRGKGIYTSMMRKRLQKAKDMGNTHVVIQAKEATSAPIAKKYGFEEQYDLEFWTYQPQEE